MFGQNRASDQVAICDHAKTDMTDHSAKCIISKRSGLIGFLLIIPAPSTEAIYVFSAFVARN